MYVFDNTMILKFGTQKFKEITVMSFKGKLFKKKRFRNSDSCTKSHHKIKFLVICNNPRIASTKTQSNSCSSTSFTEGKNSEKMTTHDIKAEIFEFS